ncbi:hypothetical protein [uncultured Methylophaga sp.]|uniref:hypothetical protein n=1 Tax=uncultured Methylophaga sp. TaxID=285271 RepID=UPI0030F75BCC
MCFEQSASEQDRDNEVSRLEKRVKELEQQLKTAKADGVREFAEKTYPTGAIYTAAEAPFAGNAKRRALQYANNLEGK